MSIVSHREIFNGQKSKETVGQEETETRVYMIKTNSPWDGRREVMLHPNTPVRWSTHPSNTRVVAQDFDLDRPEKSAYIWQLTVGYSSQAQSSGLQNMSREYTPEQQANPLLRPARISSTSSQFRKTIDKAYLLDASGNVRASGKTPWGMDINSKKVPICNAAGEPYNPPPQVDDSKTHITVSKNIAGPSYWMFDYNNIVNDSAFSIRGVSFPAGTLKVQNVSIGEDQYENEIVYCEMRMEFHHNRNGWDDDLELYNRGTFELVDVLVTQQTTKVRADILDVNGKFVRAPVPLDENGKKAVAGAPATFMRYRHYERRSLSVFTPYLS